MKIFYPISMHSFDPIYLVAYPCNFANCDSLRFYRVEHDPFLTMPGFELGTFSIAEHTLDTRKIAASMASMC